MKFAPCPENDFRDFYTEYYERCRELVPKIEAIAAKWTFEDLLPGLSDFDTRFICNDSMKPRDWTEMSMAVGHVHTSLAQREKKWARLLEHLPGINVTWEELVDWTRYYPECNQWSFYLGDADKLEEAQRTLRSYEWTERDEYFHIKKFSIYYGPYIRGIDPPINLGPFENKYPLHSRIWHYLVTPLQSALSILKKRTITGKKETLRIAHECLNSKRLIERIIDIVERHYEIPELCEDPGMMEFEEELKELLHEAYCAIVPELTIIESCPDDTPDDLRKRVKEVDVHLVQQFFELIKFSRLMKGRLSFYSEEILWFDAIPCLRIELNRIGAWFYKQPLTVYGWLRWGKEMSAEEVAEMLRGDIWTDEDYHAVMEFARLAILPDNTDEYRPVAREICAILDELIMATEKLSSVVRRDFSLTRD